MVWLRCSAIRLQELGPRLTLRLTKIQEQLCSGEVLFHAFGNSRAPRGLPCLLVWQQPNQPPLPHSEQDTRGSGSWAQGV